MKKGFTLFICLLTAQFSFATIHQTIVHEYVDNGTTIRSYDLDLDGDDDFSLEFVPSSTPPYNSKVVVHCLKSTSFYAAAGTSGATPKAYAQNAGMGTFHWENADGILADVDAVQPFNNTEKYLQVKFSDGTNDHYGWIFIEGQNYASIIVRAYAFNDVPGETIAAGQTQSTTGIGQVGADILSVTRITGSSISFQNTQAYDEVMVATIDGRVVSTIASPVAGQQYAFQQTNGVLLVSYFNKGKKVSAAKYIVQ